MPSPTPGCLGLLIVELLPDLLTNFNCYLFVGYNVNPFPIVVPFFYYFCYFMIKSVYSFYFWGFWSKKLNGSSLFFEFCVLDVIPIVFDIWSCTPMLISAGSGISSWSNTIKNYYEESPPVSSTNILY